MGYFDIPFDICCPSCGVHINGTKRIVNGHDMTINNASVVDEDLESLDYYSDFSVELPHAKTAQFESLDSLMKTNFSPFLLTASLYEGDKYFDLVKHMKDFLSFRSSCWQKLTPLYDLFFNEKVELPKGLIRTHSELPLQVLKICWIFMRIVMNSFLTMLM